MNTLDPQICFVENRLYAAGVVALAGDASYYTVLFEVAHKFLAMISHVLK
ncbi:hypothetical protein QM996_29650 (plasmid) [Sinorhizobium chiapasense]